MQLQTSYIEWKAATSWDRQPGRSKINNYSYTAACYFRWLCNPHRKQEIKPHWCPSSHAFNTDVGGSCLFLVRLVESLTKGSTTRPNMKQGVSTILCLQEVLLLVNVGLLLCPMLLHAQSKSCYKLVIKSQVDMKYVRDILRGYYRCLWVCLLYYHNCMLIK